MEGLYFNSFNLGILVEKEIVVHIEDKADGDSLASRRPSVVSVPKSVPDLRRETRTSEPLETSSSSSSPSTKMLPRSDVTGDHGDLVDFFRSPPPPGNFMSIPDDISISSADGKWSVFKVFRKRRKGKKRKPPLIQLPDSAVSARTIDGHRYIAISIPSNYSHSGPAPLKHPASEPVEEASHQAADSTRSATSDHGKKVQNPSTGDHESLSSVSIAPKKGTHPEGITRLAPPPRRVSLLSTVPSQEEPHSGKGKEPDRPSKSKSGILHRAPISPLGSVKPTYPTEREVKSLRRDQERQTELKQIVSESKEPSKKKVARIVDIPATKKNQPVRASNEPTANHSSIPPKDAIRNAGKSAEPARMLSANPVITLTVPTRTSSKRAGANVAGPGGIDDVINTRPPLGERDLSSNQSDNGNGGTTGPRGSFAESLVTTESSPKVLKAQTAMAVPIVVRPPSGPEIESPLNLNFPTPPSSKVHRSVQADLLAPPALAERTKSRKDRVRERKQRDIEKLKTKLRQAQPLDPHLLKPGVPPENAWPESPVLGRFNQELGSPHPLRPLLTGKMSDLGPTRPGLHLKPPHLSLEAVHKKRRGRSVSAPVMTSSSSPSPLESPSMPWESSTAFYRRMQREAERKEDETRRARYEAEAQAQAKEAQERLSLQKLIRRYEKLKETRAREMEERLHRLERNGDILMQSLVPLMETLNTLLQDRHGLQRSASAYQATTSAPRPHRRHHNSAPGRSQSLRSAHSSDNPPEALHLHPERSERTSRRNRPPSLRLAQRGGGPQQGEPGSSLRPRQSSLEEELERELELRGVHAGSEENVRQLTLEALQEYLRSQPHQSTRAPGTSGYTSSSTSDRSIEASSLEIMEPLMRELQEAARFAERAELPTPLTESEIFNLF
ncbi:hypothetical protein F5Y13DRAFT_205687 [Hypoxylon sp. FL1857]|nr:hypothetical protein F5Y13DRAFT_205687 [Hypoxylon sp. FL1857]